MNTYILVGSVAITHFENKDFKEFQEAILELNNGDIIGWDNSTDKVSTLLDMLNGWNNFIELTPEDLKEIEENTEIIISRN